MNDKTRAVRRVAGHTRRGVPMPHLVALLITALALALGLGLSPGAAASQAGQAPGQFPTWVASWAMAPMGTGSATDTEGALGFDNQTVRNVVRLTAGGDALRFELSNAYGEGALHVGAATVAVRSQGGGIEADTLRTATFSGSRTVVIPIGASVVSDPVDLDVAAGQMLSVSLYVPRDTGPATWHKNTQATSYISTTGDHTADRSGDAFRTTTSKYYLTEVSTRDSRTRGTIVAFGDSITEGYRSDTDAYSSYPDVLADRIMAMAGGRRMAVINEGIGGNRLLTSVDSGTKTHASGQARFATDVLSRTSVRRVLVLFGTNDLIRGNADGEPTSSLDLVTGTENLIRRAHAHGLRVVVGTIPPMGGSSVYTDLVEQNRQDFNAWVRTSGEPDGVADFDKALRDPADPSRMLAALNSGDHIHPNDAGYQAMAASIDLERLLAQNPRPPERNGYVALGQATGPGLVVLGESERPEVTVQVTSHSEESEKVTVGVDTPAGWSADPVTVTVDPGQTVVPSIPVTPPDRPAAARLVLSATSSSGELVIGHPTADVVTAPQAADTTLAIDAGTGASPVMAGYQDLGPEQAYADDAGYGWVSGTDTLDSRDRHGPDDLRRDFVFSKEPATLRVHVPAGIHHCYSLVGDTNFAAGDVAISENGKTLVTNDHPFGVGEFAWLSFVLDGGSQGRVADLTYSQPTSGNWRLDALVGYDE